jgi:hypothetical protein
MTAATVLAVLFIVATVFTIAVAATYAAVRRAVRLPKEQR